MRELVSGRQLPTKSREVTGEFIQNLDLPVQYNKDFVNGIGDKDLNNRPEIIDPAEVRL